MGCTRKKYPEGIKPKCQQLMIQFIHALDFQTLSGYQVISVGRRVRNLIKTLSKTACSKQVIGLVQPVNITGFVLPYYFIPVFFDKSE
jgi:hypothetical protein